MSPSTSALDLFQPEEVRRQAHRLLDLSSCGELRHVKTDLQKLDAAVEAVFDTTKENYPDGQIPPYGIWRDFEVGGIDRWAALAGVRAFETAEDMLTAAADLAVLASFMKTRHPADWRFEDRMTETAATGGQASALAAFHMFTSGSFSSAMEDPYRVDADTLIYLDKAELSSGLQWDRHQAGDFLEEMQRHLKLFGEALSLRPDLFGEGKATRPGLLAVGHAREGNGTVDAVKLMDNLLEALAPVWTGGAQSGDVLLGDGFGHSALAGTEGGAIVPFHTAAQDMVYSLVEPLAWAGVEVAGLDRLTAPADLAHVALFTRTGALEIRTDAQELPPEDALDRMIEIRSGAIALTDKLAEKLREGMDVSAEQLPLTCILEGGTSRAGRRILDKNPDLAKKFGHYLNPGSVFWLPFGA
ncbi:DUF1688 family protein [Roseibium aggregatum]|uniref:DUF1688 family protein n=1 Tax=Roseibium aggregatum TaxID=187304 RepID=A0A939EBG8_9HYPH|nr:DUF1688 family protein [Roseibium aggregatum]MBN9668845.1 DUF1688 family protein [Roseibium aggregatum]